MAIRKLPRRLNAALRQKASRDGMSMNAVASEAMEKGLADEAGRHRDLDFLAGTLIGDSRFDEALSVQRRIEPEMWK